MTQQLAIVFFTRFVWFVQCCPKNYTEAHYSAHPEDYRTLHPAVFLAQTSRSDNHADLCAAKNYYDTLVPSVALSSSTLKALKP